MKTPSLGAVGEEAAYNYLSRRGYYFVARNWRCKMGEIDLILRHGRELVFVEVKTRLDSKEASLHLFDTITPTKQRRLRRLADLFLQRVYSGRVAPPARIDVVGVILCGETRRLIHVEHIQAAI